jgi:hypothetical protein
MVLSIQDAQVVSTGLGFERIRWSGLDVKQQPGRARRAVSLRRTDDVIDVARLEDSFCVSVLRDVDHDPAENLGGGDVLPQEPP